MADDIARSLTDAKVRNAKPAEADYKLGDGGGLYLFVRPSGARLWRYKFRINGKEGVHSLGAYPDVSLSAARIAHRDARTLVASGTNPVASRREDRHLAKQEEMLAQGGTFERVLDDWRTATEPHLRPLSIRQRTREIAKYLMPVFRGRRVNTIKRAELAALLKRVEATAPEVAKNLRNYLSGIYEHAADVGLVDASPVPPARIMMRRVQVPHAAMSAKVLPLFLRRLTAPSTSEPATIAAMRLVILTACRKNEVCMARWSEIDIDAAEWIIPGARMKAGRDHFIPLSRQAVGIFRQLRRETNGDVVFPNRRDMDRPMADRTLNAWLERNGYAGETCHGFRALFSTHFNGKGAQADVIERCLAHAPADQIRGVYNRYEYRDERRAMLQEWADWLSKVESDSDNQSLKMVA